MKTVLKIGGSLLKDSNRIKRISSVIRDLNNQELIAVVVGGGRIGGELVSTGRELGVNEFQLDEIAIKATRANAKLVSALVNGSAEVPETVGRALSLIQSGVKPVVMGGTVPGHTTNTVAAMIAEAAQAKLVNATNVEAVFDKDPGKYSDAKKLSELSSGKLVKMAAEKDERKARGHFVFDLLAAKIIDRSGVETHVIKGDSSQIKKAVKGKQHEGTVIK